MSASDKLNQAGLDGGAGSATRRGRPGTSFSATGSPGSRAATARATVVRSPRSLSASAHVSRGAASSARSASMSRWMPRAARRSRTYGVWVLMSAGSGARVFSRFRSAPCGGRRDALEARASRCSRCRRAFTARTGRPRPVRATGADSPGNRVAADEAVSSCRPSWSFVFLSISHLSIAVGQQGEQDESRNNERCSGLPAFERQLGDQAPGESGGDQRSAGQN